MNLLIRVIAGLLVNAVALWIAVEIVPRANFDGSFIELLVVAFVFGLVNAIIRPLVRLLTLPLSVLTLGLFTFVVNGAMLLLTSALSDTLSFEGEFFTRLGSATLAALIVSVVSVAVAMVIALLLPDGE